MQTRSPEELARLVRLDALQAGFDLVGVAAAAPPAGLARLDEWLARGFAGEMTYLARRRAAYADPASLLEGARSLVMVALGYRTDDPRPPAPGEGRVSRYAWGDGDYHAALRTRLYALADKIREREPAARTRAMVDSAPLLERDFAVAAGLGWCGKNTLVLHPSLGSWFFLGSVLTTARLAPDEPEPIDRCGSCTACLDACPTNAFPEPGVLDATRCVSYWTIEAKGLPPAELRDGLGPWVFGCDVCQDVCPWNRRAPRSPEPLFAPRADNDPIELLRLLAMDEPEFRRRFRHTPLWRPRREGLARNAALALGATRPPGGELGLARGLTDTAPTVRAACAWALGRYATGIARAALEYRAAVEADEVTRREIAAALAACDATPAPEPMQAPEAGRAAAATGGPGGVGGDGSQAAES